MNWTLLVPGGLLPPALAPELSRSIRAPLLIAQLALARPVPPRASPGAFPIDTGARQSAHWQWLAQRLGVDADDLPTAPYAWRGASAHRSSAPLEPENGGMQAGMWIAHCEPVHMAIARDHFVVTDLARAPLQEAEASELLERANAVLEAETSSSAGHAAPRLQIAVNGGRWFLLSPRPLDLTTWALDAVLGQSVQYRLPTGKDARRWRVLANEVQMSWHASRANDAREAAGQDPANGLWLHGGGVWQPLAAVPPMDVHAQDAPAEAAALRGWLSAAAASTGPAGESAPGSAPVGAAPQTLSICRALFPAYAHQAWESWLAQWPVLEARLEADLAAARRAGARRFDLVLCGAAGTRSITLPLQAPWWRRLRAGSPAPAALLQRWLTEAPPAAAPHSKTRGAAANGALAA